MLLLDLLIRGSALLYCQVSKLEMLIKISMDGVIGHRTMGGTNRYNQEMKKRPAMRLSMEDRWEEHG